MQYSQRIDNRSNNAGPVVTILVLRVVEGEHNPIFSGDYFLTTFTHTVERFIDSIKQYMYPIYNSSLKTTIHYTENYLLTIINIKF